ncbi:MAG: RagB/SusD family nutrient uptake outer membrane protein [Rikenellaceae bacterium]|nr:RagB/SusD family nutrient uptake outer membrane protein [Rikenellaceae bacterium]MCL2693300.1 RagB/SusD family nutrient uptake outer membrane protein [Rikenellaceae bacterium]
MMKTKIKILACLIMAALASACNNWLDVDLEDRVDEHKLYATAQGFYESLAGVYSTMADSTMYGSALTLEYIDLLGQYYSYTSIRQETYQRLQDFDYDDASVKRAHANIWQRMYKAIAQLNNIIEWTDRNSRVLTEAERRQIRGEATALRAYLHFDLYRMFSPDVKRHPRAQSIPYNKQFGVSLPPMYTAEEVVQLVINDLREAEQLLADDPIRNVVPYMIDNKNMADRYVARINLWSVRAMLARVHQARGEWSAAIAAAQSVITSGKFRMMDFADIDRGESQLDALFSAEHVFSLRNKWMPRINTSLFRDRITPEMTTFMPLSHVSYSVICEGNNDDARLSIWFPAGSGFMKWLYGNAETIYPKMPMIKLSEMYLVIAESSFESGDQATALAYINMLRDRRIRNNTHLQFISRETLIGEMRREYIGEGQMWYAFKRLHATLPSSSPTAGEVEPSDAIFVFPMPDAEIEDGNRDKVTF